jgi:hypothetical protein
METSRRVVVPVSLSPKRGRFPGPLDVTPFEGRSNPSILLVTYAVSGVHVDSTIGRFAMVKVSRDATVPTVDELDRMHALYRQGGRERRMAPHIVYPEISCPHDGCEQSMQASISAWRTMVEPSMTRWCAPGGMIPGSSADAHDVTAGSTSPSYPSAPLQRMRQPSIRNCRTIGMSRRSSSEPRIDPVVSSPERKRTAR